MKYLFSDFYFLCGAAAKESRTVGDAYRVMCAHMGVPASSACLRHAIRGLVAGGYVTVSGEDPFIHPGTALSVTPLGKEAVAISWLQKLAGEDRAFAKNELRFCSVERPAVAEDDGLCVDFDAFERMIHPALQSGELTRPLLTVGDEHLTVNGASGYSFEDNEEDEDPDAPERASCVSVTGDPLLIRAGMSDLLSAALALLTDAPRTRKVALHGADKSLIVTLSQAAGEEGTVLRMTVSRILFNRKRFIGKRDSDLDYAQCSDPLILREMGWAKSFAAALLPCAVSLPEHLSDEDLEVVHTLHKLLRQG